MVDLYIYLSGDWPVRRSFAKSGVDHILVGPSQQTPEGFSKILTPQSLSPDQCKKLATQLIENFNISDDNQAFSIIECLLNDYYSYTLRSIFSTLLTVDKLIKTESYSNIIIVSAKTNTKYPPMVGFQTTESKRGSKNLLGAYTASLLPVVFKKYRFRFISLKGDVFCRQKFRSVVIGLFNKIFCFMLLIKVLLLHWKLKNSTSNCVPNMMVVRSWHQARFAEKLLSRGNDNFSVAVFPQATQGSIANSRKCINIFPSNVKTVGLSSKDIFRSYMTYRRDMKSVKSVDLSKWINKQITVDGVSLNHDFKGLYYEMKMISVIILYKNLLSTLLVNSGASKLVNFELVGRMAGLEALAAREVGISVESIQTALISSSKHPIFPYSDKFYTDGTLTKNLIENIGIKRKGIVIFEGPPFIIEELRSPIQFNFVSFFTQPYEPDITIKILEVLGAWAIQRNIKVIVKLHPRDRLAVYETLLINNQGLLFVQNVSVEKLIKKSDLVITRTSSVAKEAISCGVPLLLTLWSDLDRSIHADYVVKHLLDFYSAQDSEQLLGLINNKKGIIDCVQLIRTHLFEGKDIQDLVNKVSAS